MTADPARPTPIFVASVRRVWQIAAWPFPRHSVACAVFLLTAAELLLLRLHTTGFWDNSGLLGEHRWAFMLAIFAFWSLASWVAYWHILVLIRMCRTRAGAAKLLVLASTFLAAIAASAYVVSWICYWRLGLFPDSDTIWFAALNAGMLSKYFWQAERSVWLVTSSVAVVLVPVAAAGGVGAYRWLSSARSDRAWPTSDVIAKHAFFAVVTLNAVVLNRDYAADRADMVAPRDQIDAARVQWPPYEFELRYHANPAITVALSFLRQWQDQPATRVRSDALKPLGRLIPSSFPEISRAARKNIVLVVVESLRSDAVLMEHQQKVVMPYLAQLARSGRFFPNCYANSTHSDYSDPSILSSLFPLRTAGRHFYRNEEPWPKVLVYDVLKQYGYGTAIFSSQNESWSNMHLFYRSPYLDVLFDSRSLPDLAPGDRGSLSEWMIESGQLAGKLNDAITVRRACDWIHRQRDNGVPFFLVLNLQTSHFPYQLPAGVPTAFEPSLIDFEASFIKYPAEKCGVVRNAYLNSLRYLDAQLGTLRARVKIS